jgi:hypothetical protein
VDGAHVWGEKDGEVRFDPDESVEAHGQNAAQFSACGLVANSALEPRTQDVCSPARCMLAHTFTGGLIVNATWMTKEGCANEPAFCPWPSGRCSFSSIIPATLIGLRSNPTKHASIPTCIPGHTKREAP